MPAEPYQDSKALAYTPVRKSQLLPVPCPCLARTRAALLAACAPARLPARLPARPPGTVPGCAPHLPRPQVMSRALVLEGGQQCADRVNLAYKTLQGKLSRTTAGRQELATALKCAGWRAGLGPRSVLPSPAASSRPPPDMCSHMAQNVRPR